MCDLKSHFSHSMCSFLPTGEYSICGPDFLQINNICTIDDTEWGYLINCTLKYPSSLKPFTSDFPLIPTKTKLDLTEMISFNNETFDAMTTTSLSHVVLTQHDKKNVLLHYKFLQWAMQMGMICDNVHYVIKYRHSDWLKKYMLYIAKLRHDSKHPFENQLLKNFSNQLYGRFYPQTTRLTIKFCTSRQDSMRLTSQAEFNDVLVLNPNLTMYTFKKRKMLYDKNLLISFVILQNSILTFYRHIYHLKSFFGPRFSILGAETDSITAKYKDVNRDFIMKLSSLDHLFDFSDLPTDHPLYSQRNSTQIGIFKLEYAYPIEWVKLRSKVYCVKILCKLCKKLCGPEELETCNSCVNGVSTVSKGNKNATPFSVYMKVLNNENQVHSEYYTVNARNERIRFLKRKAKALTATDWKRIWINPLESKPFGHNE